MSEKSITRYDPQMVDSPDGSFPGGVPVPNGIWVTYDDHLAALGEAEKEREDELCRCVECGHLQAEPNWCHRCGHRTSQPPWAKRLLGELEAAKEGAEAAEQKLQALIQGLKAEVERWRELAADERRTAKSTEERGLANRCWVRASTYSFAIDRLQKLLDRAETVGETDG